MQYGMSAVTEQHSKADASMTSFITLPATWTTSNQYVGAGVTHCIIHTQVQLIHMTLNLIIKYLQSQVCLDFC
jgi:hypothetical protein